MKRSQAPFKVKMGLFADTDSGYLLGISLSIIAIFNDKSQIQGTLEIVGYSEVQLFHHLLTSYGFLRVFYVRFRQTQQNFVFCL